MKKYFPIFAMVFALYVMLSHEPPMPVNLTVAETAEIKPVDTVKVEAVKDIANTEIKGPKYTIRKGLDGYRKNTPRITSTTFDGRAKEWLEDTGGIGNTHAFWKSMGVKYKMDYALPICIAWADSHTGKALKTKNNIGNLGNTDSGATKEFETLEEGISGIYWNLAHGSYMKGHTILGTLSNEGRIRLGLPSCVTEKNATKKCYAMSATGWSTNIVNCLSVIHNKQIDENYLFRN